MNFSHCSFFLVAVFFVSGDALMDPCGSQREKCMSQAGISQQDLLNAEQLFRNTSVAIDITTILDVKVIEYFRLFMIELGCLNANGLLDYQLLVEVFRYGCPRVLSIEIFTSVSTSIYAGKAPASSQIVGNLIKFIHRIIQLIPKVIFDLMGMCKPPVMPSTVPLLTCTVNFPTGILG